MVLGQIIDPIIGLVLDHLGRWDEIRPLVEFTYNNNYY